MSELVKWSLIGVASGLGLWVVDCVLLKFEAKGYIYYRKKKARLTSVGSALMEFHGFLEPTKRYVVEARQQVVQQENDAAPPDPEEGRWRLAGTTLESASAPNPDAKNDEDLGR